MGILLAAAMRHKSERRGAVVQRFPGRVYFELQWVACPECYKGRADEGSFGECRAAT
jgi:hypothetical protein